MALVVEVEEAGEEFFAGGGGDGVAGAVVFGEGFDFVEVVAEGEVGPAVGVADGVVELDVEVAELPDALESVGGFGGIAFGNFGDLLRCETGGVEEVVGVGEADPEVEHELSAVFVIGGAKGGEGRVGGGPESVRESEGAEAVAGGVAEILF